MKPEVEVLPNTKHVCRQNQKEPLFNTTQTPTEKNREGAHSKKKIIETRTREKSYFQQALPRVFQRMENPTPHNATFLVRFWAK